MAGRGVEDGLEDHTLHKKKKNYEHYAIYFSICYVFYWEFPTELCDIFCGFASQKLGLNDVACCYECVRYC